MSNLSLQLYTIREQLAADPDATLAAVAATGLTEVEPFGITAFRDWLPAALAKHGLKVVSTHTDVLGDFEGSIAAAKELGATFVIQPFYDPEKWKTREGVEELAAKLNEAAKKAAAEGITVGYHNHHFEFVNEIDDAPAYEYFVNLLDDDVKLEIDTYWVAMGGYDPVGVVDELGDLVTHLHIKDGPVDLDNDHAPNVVLGEGSVDLPTLLDANPDKTWVVEFDSTAGDIMADIAASVKYLQNR